jgi:ribosomal protein S18
MDMDTEMEFAKFCYGSILRICRYSAIRITYAISWPQVRMAPNLRRPFLTNYSDMQICKKFISSLGMLSKQSVTGFACISLG